MSNNFYEVKKGDTLWSICKKEFNLTSNREIANKVAEIQKVNSIFGDQIDVGQKINLGVDNKVSNNTAKAPEQPVTKQAETKETVAPTNTQANQETTPKDTQKESFVKFIKDSWSKLIWSPKTSENTKVNPSNSVLALDDEKPTEEVIPEGHIKAPNGMITKMYSKKEIEQLIEDTCREHNVDSSLVRAIISVESSNNQFARSKVGAQGLMQLMPNGAGKGLENAYDAKANIERGVKEFARLRRFYGNNIDALRAYNYGERRYNEYLSGERAVLPKETEDYPEKVLSRYEKYSRAV